MVDYFFDGLDVMALTQKMFCCEAYIFQMRKKNNEKNSRKKNDDFEMPPSNTFNK